MTAETLAPTVDQFDAGYKARMIQAYPAIAQMDPEEMFYGTIADREAAFQRVLDSPALRSTHQAYLDDRPRETAQTAPVTIERRSTDDD